MGLFSKFQLRPLDARLYRMVQTAVQENQLQVRFKVPAESAHLQPLFLALTDLRDIGTLYVWRVKGP